MQISLLGDDILRQKCEPVRPIGPEYKQLAADMLETLKKEKGIGIAGPQVGLLKRIFVTSVEGDVPRVFINPSIIGTSPEQVKLEEGCLSIPDIYADVLRPEKVSVQAYNEKGKPFTLEADGMLARVIQHENDHLDGVLFIDHLPDAKRTSVVAKYEKKRAAKERRKGMANKFRRQALGR
jgi:peptide deformylase